VVVTIVEGNKPHNHEGTCLDHTGSGRRGRKGAWPVGATITEEIRTLTSCSLSSLSCCPCYVYACVCRLGEPQGRGLVPADAHRVPHGEHAGGEDGPLPGVHRVHVRMHVPLNPTPPRSPHGYAFCLRRVRCWSTVVRCFLEFREERVPCWCAVTGSVMRLPRPLRLTLCWHTLLTCLLGCVLRTGPWPWRRRFLRASDGPNPTPTLRCPPPPGA
jgi:hypothetical protein